MKNWCIIIFAILAIIFGYLLLKREKPEIEYSEVVRYDTVFIEKPVPVSQVVVRRDTVYLPVVARDSIPFVVKDSVLVQVPISDYVFEKDSIFRAEIRGFNVSLEKMTVYPKTVIQKETKYLKPPRLGIGIQTGIGYTDRIVPYVGIGISYTLFQIK